MYQKVISPPAGDGIVRCATFDSSAGDTVVNGSTLHIPQGTVALVYVKGTLYGKFLPGVRTIFTGEDPFFVKLRHIMSHGDPAVTVTVFWVATEKNKFMQLGTGELTFRYERFKITMTAYCACTLTYTVVNPAKLVTALVGSYATMVTDDDIEHCLNQLVLRPLRETLTGALNSFNLTEVNAHLTELGNAVTPAVRTEFENFGVSLERCVVTAVNISPESLALLNKLEADIGIDLARLYEFCGGDLDKLLLYLFVRGTPDGHRADPMEYARYIPGVRETFAGTGAAGTVHTDLLDPTGAGATPRPAAGKRCTTCGNTAAPGRRTCPVCGATLI